VAVPTKLPSLMALRLDFVTATTLVFLVRAMVAVVPSIVVDGHRVRTDGTTASPEEKPCPASQISTACLTQAARRPSAAPSIVLAAASRPQLEDAPQPTRRRTDRRRW
jgi:hypothetical protein